MKYLIKRRNIRWKNDICSKIFIVMLFILGAASAVGAPNVETAKVSSSAWLDQWDLPRILITGLFAVCAFFLIRVINKFDGNMEEIFNRLRQVEKKQGEQEVRCDERHDK